MMDFTCDSKYGTASLTIASETSMMRMLFLPMWLRIGIVGISAKEGAPPLEGEENLL